MASENPPVPNPPVITICTTALIGGTEATPNTIVKVFDMDLGRVQVTNAPAIVLGDGTWSIVPDPASAPIQLGDQICACSYTLLPDGSAGAASAFSDPATLAPPVPNAPVISICSTTLIGGTETTPNTVVKAFNFSAGEIPVAPAAAAAEDGSWGIVPDPAFAPIQVGDDIRARSYLLLPDGSAGAASAFSDPAYVTPAVPGITVSTTSLISGTEATPNTVVKVFNLSTGETPVTSAPAVVVNGSWSLVPDSNSPLHVGDLIEARAYQMLSDGSEGAESARSSSYVVEPDTPVITVYSSEYFAGTEGTAGASIMLYDVSNSSVPLNKAPIPVQNGQWNCTSENLAYPVSIGGEIVARASVSVSTGQNIASRSSKPVIVASVKSIPIPPEIDKLSGTVLSGKTLPNSWVVVYIPNAFTINIVLGRTYSADGTWSFDVATSGLDLTSQKVYFAGASYDQSASPTSGNLSWGYSWVVDSTTRPAAPVITTITPTALTGTVSPGGLTCLGWRTSDGSMVVETTASDSGTFTIPILGENRLAEGDTLNLLCGDSYPDGPSPFTQITRP